MVALDVDVAQNFTPARYVRAKSRLHDVDSGSSGPERSMLRCMLLFSAGFCFWVCFWRRARSCRVEFVEKKCNVELSRSWSLDLTDKVPTLSHFLVHTLCTTVNLQSFRVFSVSACIPVLYVEKIYITETGRGLVTVSSII